MKLKYNFIKKTTCILLVLIFTFAFTYVGVVPTTTANASTENVTYSGGWRDEDGYQLIPLGYTKTLGPAYAIYQDRITGCEWSTTNKNVVSISPDFDYCTIRATGLGYASVLSTTESFYSNPVVSDLRYYTDTYKYRVVKPVTSIKLQKSASLYIGNTKSLNITSTPNSNYSRYASNIKYYSSNTSVATVNGYGVVTGVKAGKATITAKTSNGLSTSCTVTIKKPAVEKISIPSEVTIIKGDAKQLNATLSPYGSSAKVKWSSSNKKVAKVDKNGIVKAKKPGKAIITAKINSKIHAKCKVVVTKSPNKIKLNKNTLNATVGNTYTLTSTVKPSKAVTTVTWSSSDTSVATVSSTGVITPKSPGTVKIIAKTHNNKKAVCKVTVKYPPATSIKLNKTSLEFNIKENEIYDLNYIVTPTKFDGSVTWHSSNSSVATVNSAGVVTPISLGTAVITAKINSNVYAQCTVTVNNDPLDPQKYLKFTCPRETSWPTDYKYISYTDSSDIGFTVDQTTTYLTDMNGKRVVLTSVEKGTGLITLNYSSTYVAYNTTLHSFYIYFDGVKYLVEGSAYSQNCYFEKVG